MPYKPIPDGQFRGLVLDREVDEVGPSAAIDLLNVEFDRRGAVRSRDGYAKLTSSAGSTRYDSVGAVSTGSTNLVAGPTSAGAGTDDGTFGFTTWTNPGNIVSSNNSYATANAVSFQSTHLLRASTFGFAIPSTATILGIVVEMERKSSTSGTKDQWAYLCKAGVITGSNKADTTHDWPTSDTYKTYGSATDLWGDTWTPTQVNASGFGFGMACNPPGGTTVSVDHIRITVYYTAANTAYVISGATAGRLDAINSDGSVATTVATGSDQQAFYANFGSPTTAATYIAVGTGSAIRKYAGGSFSVPGAAMPKGRYVAVQSPDNRLVVANISTIPSGAGSTASSSLVHFSGAGTPETFAANDYEYLTPGDGEDIQGMVAWREHVLVFKSTQYFDFFGNDTDPSTGTSIFNYRPIKTGIGLASPLALAVAPEGLYFVDRRGIYRTTGGDPQLVSSAVDPLFLGGASDFYLGGAINPTAFSQISLCFFSNRLYMGFPSGSSSTNNRVLVLDPATGDFTLWNTPMGVMAAVGSQPQDLVFTYSQGTNDLGHYRPNAYDDDAGTAISYRYRSGFYTVGNVPSQEVEIRETPMEGIGSVTFSVSRDFQDVPTSGGGAQQTVVMAPATAQGRHRKAQRGRRFSYQIEGVTAARVDGFVHHIREIRPAGEQTD